MTDNGRLDALRLGEAIGSGVLVVSSPVLRAVETATAIAEGAGLTTANVPEIDALVKFVRLAADDTYESVKRRRGWKEMMRARLDGCLPPDILASCHAVAHRAIVEALKAGTGAECSRVIAVTHDSLVMAILASIMWGTRATSVPYLSGVFVGLEEATFLQKGINP